MFSNVGVLDSGVGGLSVLSELVNVMPNNNFLYFGDTKNMPYGTKTSDEIYSYTKKIIEFFIKKNVKNVVFACNTTSAVAYDKLSQEYQNSLKIFPLIQTVAKSAVENLKDGDTIAIFATRATINSKKYETEIKKYNSKINVLGVDCTGFVEIVENRLYDNKESFDLIKSKMDIVQDFGAKRLVLGCTHYPYLINLFKKINPNIEYFNPAGCLAEIVKEAVIKDNNFTDTKGNVEFFVSKNPEEFRKSGALFFDIKNRIELINQ